MVHFKIKQQLQNNPKRSQRQKGFDCNCMFTLIFPIANFLRLIYQHSGTYMYRVKERERERERERELGRKRDAATQYLGSQMT